MSKKPDFTQKLLTDLRLRKQRLAAQTASPDGPENLHRPYHGQGRKGEINIHKTKTYQPSHGRRKPLAVEEFSTDIVPIQAARSREYMTDLSMALAFALENGGRLGNIQFLGNPVMQKKASLHLAQRRSVSLGDMSGKFTAERNQQQLVPSQSNLSHVHITEISKGAHRLNQILKACSQGLHFDGYSIEIGRELLKGAVDLEESLRMLVSLQEASQYMVSPQRKHRAQLHEVDEDEEAEIQEKLPKFPEKPRFSFDKSSKNSKAPGSRENKKPSSPAQKQPVRSYAPNSKIHQRETESHSIAISNSVSHKGSVSFDPSSGRRNVRSNKSSNHIKSTPPVITANNNAPPTLSKNGIKMQQLTSQAPEQEKARIPNVIAKLMGLEEVSLRSDSKETDKLLGIHRQDTSKHENSKHEARRSIRQVDAVVSNYEKPVPQVTQELMVVPANRIAPPGNTMIATMQTQSTIKGKFERIDFYIEPQTSTSKVDQAYPTRFAKMERQGREAAKQDQPSYGKSEYAFSRARRQVYTSEFRDKHREYIEAADSENIGIKKTTVQMPFKNYRLGIPILGNQQEFIHERESKGSSAVRNSEMKESHDREIEKNAKSKPQVTEARKTRMVSKNLQKQMLEANIQKQILRKNQIMVAGKKGSIQTANVTNPKEESSIPAVSNTRKSVPSREEQELIGPKNDTGKAAIIIQLTEPMKMTNMLSVQKAVVAESFETQESKMTKPEEKKIRMDVYPQVNRQRKQNTSVLLDVKQIRHEQIMKAKEAIKSIQILEQSLQQKNFPASTSYDHAWGDEEKQKEMRESKAGHARNDQGREKEAKVNTTSGRNIHSINSKGPTELAPPEISPGGDQFSDPEAIQSKGTGPGNNNATANSNAIIKHPRPHVKPEKQRRSLTTHEKQLKEILLNSQHFLNAAEALFRLQIPIEMLHNSRNKHQNQSNQLMLDCAYEIMKRKGEREELVFHPSVRMPVATSKAKCLDDLVEVLHEDMEDLEFHGESGGAISDSAAAHLQSMLKRDVQDRKGDVNCMWDLGWNVNTFTCHEKDEVAKDVEKHILNRLIDETIGDVLHISIGRMNIEII